MAIGPRRLMPGPAPDRATPGGKRDALLIEATRVRRHRDQADATILVVGHSRTGLGVLGSRLTDAGYRAVLSATGPEALDVLAVRGIDVVLLDMTQPGVSGLQILHEIRRHRATADLPVITLTAPSDDAAAVDALGAGADDQLAMPFGFDLLVARIARVLARARRVAELKRANASLDARIATRAIELGEANSVLATTQADRTRLIASLQALNAQVERLSGTSASR